MKRTLLDIAALCFAFWIMAFSLSHLVGATAWADDDHRGRRSGFYSDDEHKGYGGRDHGNETTGEIAAWLFGIANATVLLSFLSRGAIASSSGETMKKAWKRFNRRQKKWLLPLHYVFNPIAALVAVLHFSLSSCRSTGLPEWTLAGLLTLLALGLAIKFKWAPKSLRRNIHSLHTHPLVVSAAFGLLFLGHQLMD